MKLSRLIAFASLVGACANDSSVELAEVSQAASVCAGPTTTFGIDVSRFQGDIDWDLVAAADVKFAFIQISRSLTDVDVKFPYNWKRAKEVGILRGAYQRFHPNQDVIAQADLFLSKLGPYRAGDLPPVLDVEDADGQTAAQIAAKTRQWLEYVEQKLGIRPILYTGYYFWEGSVAGADFSDYPLWLANYGSSCPMVPGEWAAWTIHQYSSSAQIPGITANSCDVNKFNGTLAELQALAKPPVCGDEACNGDETSDSCAEDCPPCGVIEASAVEDGILDDDSACFTAGGNPAFIRTEKAGYGGGLKWTHATELEEAANFGRWDLFFAKAGRYRVDAYTAAPYAMSKLAVYEVHHAGGTSDVPLDQTAVDGWSSLGEFEFAAGGQGQFVRLDDNTGELNASDTQLVFDALRFTLIEDDDHGSKGDFTGSEDPGAGCSTGRGQSSALVLLALAFVARRRRRPLAPDTLAVGSARRSLARH